MFVLLLHYNVHLFGVASFLYQLCCHFNLFVVMNCSCFSSCSLSLSFNLSFVTTVTHKWNEYEYESSSLVWKCIAQCIHMASSCWLFCVCIYNLFAFLNQSVCLYACVHVQKPSLDKCAFKYSDTPHRIHALHSSEIGNECCYLTTSYSSFKAQQKWADATLKSFHLYWW